MVHLARWKTDILLTEKDKDSVISEAVKRGIITASEALSIVTVFGYTTSMDGNQQTLHTDKDIALNGLVVFDEQLKDVLWDH